MDTLKKIAYNININLENYYNKTECDALYVNVTGDTITGHLILTGASYLQLNDGVSVNEITTNISSTSSDNELATAKSIYLMTSGTTSGEFVNKSGDIMTGHLTVPSLSAQTFIGNLDWSYITNKPTIHILQIDSSGYTLDDSGEYFEIILHCISGSTITLQTNQLTNDSLISIKNISNSTVIVNTEGSEKIDNENTQTISNYDSMSIYPYNNNWWIK